MTCSTRTRVNRRRDSCTKQTSWTSQRLGSSTSTEFTLATRTTGHLVIWCGRARSANAVVPCAAIAARGRQRNAVAESARWAVHAFRRRAETFISAVSSSRTLLFSSRGLGAEPSSTAWLVNKVDRPSSAEEPSGARNAHGKAGGLCVRTRLAFKRFLRPFWAVVPDRANACITGGVCSALCFVRSSFDRLGSISTALAPVPSCTRPGRFCKASMPAVFTFGAICAPTCLSKVFGGTKCASWAWKHVDASASGAVETLRARCLRYTIGAHLARAALLARTKASYISKESISALLRTCSALWTLVSCWTFVVLASHRRSVDRICNGRARPAEMPFSAPFGRGSLATGASPSTNARSAFIGRDQACTVGERPSRARIGVRCASNAE